LYIAGEHNYYIIMLSIIILITACYISLNIVSKISIVTYKYKLFWLFTSAITMGIGIWSFHFIGMLAFQINIKITYHFGLTFLSAVAVITGSFIAFYLIVRKNLRGSSVFFAGLFMAISIILMDYLAMKAMRMPATMSHELPWMIVSMVIAFIASYLSLFIFIQFRKNQANKLITLLSAIVMSIAISGAHYAGKLATKYFIANEQVLTPYSLNTTLLYEVIISIVILYCVAMLLMFYERNLL